MRGKWALVVAAFVAVVVALPPAAAIETVTEDTTRTETVGARSHHAYAVQTGGKNVEIRVSVTGSDVDFYIFTSQDYSEYTNPSLPRFGLEEAQENTRAFTYTMTRSGLILVVDNDDVSASGASPSGPVAYSLSFRFVAVNWAPVIAVIVLILVAVVIAIAFVARRRKARAPPPIYTASPAAPGYASPAATSPYGTTPAPPRGIPPPPPPAASATSPEATAPGAVEAAVRQCPNCGRPVVAKAAFCTSCGARMT